MRLAKIYAPWILAPVALLLAGVLFLPKRDLERGESPRDAVIGEKKVRSSLKFHALTRGGLDDTPLHTINRPGLAIDLSIDPKTYKHMLIRGVRNIYKRRTTNVAVRFGELEPSPAVLRLRGASSLTRGPRVNFEITLLSPGMITPQIELRRFYLVNMRSDPFEFKLEFAYRLLRKLGLFPPYHQYVKVLVNGEPQGMFLLVERPRNAIRRVHPGAVSIYRRGRHFFFHRQWSRSVPFAGQQIEALRRLLREEDIENPLSAMARVLDVDAYMTWSGVNSIVKNTDTVGELFLYEVREKRDRPEPLRVMAWDFDEILEELDAPLLFDDPLLYSRKTRNDMLINEPDVYAHFRTILKRLLTRDLTIEYLVDQLREVQALRDRLDDGLAEEVQEENRRQRKAIIDKFESDLRERHLTLCERLESSR